MAAAAASRLQQSGKSREENELATAECLDPLSRLRRLPALRTPADAAEQLTQEQETVLLHTRSADERFVTNAEQHSIFRMCCSVGLELCSSIVGSRWDKLGLGPDPLLQLAVIGRTPPAASFEYVNAYFSRTFACPSHPGKLVHASLRAGEILLKCTSSMRHVLFTDRLTDEESVTMSVLLELGSLSDVLEELLAGTVPLPAPEGGGRACGATAAFAWHLAPDDSDTASLCSSLAPTPLAGDPCPADFPSPSCPSPGPCSPAKRAPSAAAEGEAAAPPPSPWSLFGLPAAASPARRRAPLDAAGCLRGAASPAARPAKRARSSPEGPAASPPPAAGPVGLPPPLFVGPGLEPESFEPFELAF